MKTTALMMLLLLAGMAYGQSEKVPKKGTNEFGLNYNSWHYLHHQRLTDVRNFSYYSFGYGHWVSDKMQLGANLGYSDLGYAGTFLTASTFARHYFVSNSVMGFYANGELGIIRTNMRPFGDPDGDKSVAVNSFAQVGLGFEYRITPKLLGFVETNYKHVLIPKRGSGGVMNITAGLRYRF